MRSLSSASQMPSALLAAGSEKKFELWRHRYRRRQGKSAQRRMQGSYAPFYHNQSVKLETAAAAKQQVASTAASSSSSSSSSTLFSWVRTRRKATSKTEPSQQPQSRQPPPQLPRHAQRKRSEEAERINDLIRRASSGEAGLAGAVSERRRSIEAETHRQWPSKAHLFERTDESIEAEDINFMVRQQRMAALIQLSHYSRTHIHASTYR